MRADGLSSKPVLGGMQERADGVLLTIVRVPEADIPEPKPEQPGATIPWNDHFDTIIEATDPATGTLLAAVRSDLAFAGFVPGSDGLLLAHDELPDGRIVARVWRPLLTRP